MSFEKWENDLHDSYYEDEPECDDECEDGPDPEDFVEPEPRTRRENGRTVHELDFIYDPLRGH